MAEPISLDRAKLYLRVDHGAEDDLIGGMIADARSWVEDYTGQTLEERAVTMSIDRFDAPLPAWPIIEVTAVKYRDGSGVEQTLAPSAYELDATARPARLMMKDGLAWPGIAAGRRQITVEVAAGYEVASDIPGGLIRAIYILLDAYYQRIGLTDDIRTAAENACGLKSRRRTL